MSEKYYRLHCEPCGWKKDVKEEFFTSLKEIQAVPLQGHIPQWDEEKKKVVVFPKVKRKRQFKCPKCGRLVSPKRMVDVQGELDERADFEARSKKTREKDWAQRDQDRLEGCPIQGDFASGDEAGDHEVPPEPDVQL